jgi:hypothetical protein
VRKDKLKDKLEECIGCFIECIICQRKEKDYGVDPWMMANDLYAEGWRSDNNHNVRCPNCKGKRLKN